LRDFSLENGDEQILIDKIDKAAKEARVKIFRKDFKEV
jgi:hypothetical protein